ncbi:hypothetical protein YN1HA_17690 [Sulfurisphaera ohwakuensis]
MSKGFYSFSPYKAVVNGFPSTLAIPLILILFVYSSNTLSFCSLLILWLVVW